MASPSILIYEQAAGQGRVVDFQQDGSMVDGETHTGWPNSWDIIIPGNFWMPDEEDRYFPNLTKNQRITSCAFTDLFFYDLETGHAYVSP